MAMRHSAEVEHRVDRGALHHLSSSPTSSSQQPAHGLFPGWKALPNSSASSPTPTPERHQGCARVSTAKQDLDRQIDALTTVGIDAERIYLDKKSGATTDRPGLRVLLDYARSGDVIVVHILDRLGRTVRDTLNLIHELAERGVGVRNLAGPQGGQPALQGRPTRALAPH